MQRLKLKPSARDNRRYFIVPKGKDIDKIILEYLGVLGAAKAKYIEIKTEDFPGKIVGSVERKMLDDVRGALVLAGICVEKVSGTIKGLGR